MTEEQLGLFAKVAPLPTRRAYQRIRIGTSSWSDPGFVADWYPPTLPARARLGWYAQHFDYVEVNSSFYAIPAERAVERWTHETPDGFMFDVKLHKLLSRHAAGMDSLPPDLRKHAEANARGNVVLTPEIELLVAERILKEIEPLRTSGKLGGLLLQLSPSFSPKRHSLDELLTLQRHFASEQLSIELRNRDLTSETNWKATMNFFREHRLPLVLVDTPESEHFTVMPASDELTSPTLAYLRLHGRNEKGYISGKSVAERFDYDYSPAEIEGIADRVSKLAAHAQEVHVAFNNNRSHYAPKAALALKQRIR